MIPDLKVVPSPSVPRGAGDNGGSGRNTGGGGSSGGGEMDGRIRALESGMTDVKVALGKIETRLDFIERNMVTKGQLAIYALLTVLSIAAGGWWIVQQYLAPILRAVPK